MLVSTTAQPPVQLLERVWERIMEHPGALAATVDALQRCQGNQSSRLADYSRVEGALVANLGLLRRPAGDKGREGAARPNLPSASAQTQ